MTQIDAEDMRRAAPHLHVGDEIELSGTVYTARDAVHKLIEQLLRDGKAPPFPLEGAVIYYAGPTQTPKGAVCGAFGPTTSGRMDAFTPLLLEKGVAATIGKGQRSAAVTEAIVKYKSPYFAALGGAGALAACHIAKCEVIAFEQLGCEAVRRLTFDRFPLYVATDIYGRSIYERA